MQFLRQNTAVIVTVGPFYDKTDGVTIETALTITNEKITLTADTDAGSAPTNILDNVTGATSGTANDLNYITGNDAGMMQMELAAADVNRVGRMMLSITDAANHVPVFHEFFVLPAALFDWLTGVTANLPVNAVQFAAQAITAAAGVTLPSSVASPTNITAGTITTVTNLTNLPSIPANWLTATGIQADAITAAKIADGAIDNATFAADAISASKINADVATEIAAPVLAVLGALNDAAADGVPTTTDTVMAYIKQLINDLEGTAGIVAWPASVAPGNGVSIAEALRYLYDQVGVAGAALTAADDAVITAVATLQTTANTIAGYLDTEVAAILAAVDTEVAAIKAKTDSLTFTVANQVDSNVKAISDDATAADRLEAGLDGVIVGQVNAGVPTTTAFIGDGFTEATNDHFKGRLLTFISGALTGQSTQITAYTGGTQTFTVVALTEAPADNDYFVIN